MEVQVPCMGYGEGEVDGEKFVCVCVCVCVCVVHVYINTYILFLSTILLTRTALCSLYSLHTSITRSKQSGLVSTAYVVSNHT